MEDSINTIINNATIADKTNLSNNIDLLLNSIRKAIYNNKEAFKATNLIDKKNNNGFMLDFSVIDNIFNNLEKESLKYGDVILSTKDDTQQLIYGKQIMDIGTVLVVNDGNTYALIEIIIKSIMAGNATIIANDGYMYGTNQLLIQIVRSVLEQYNLSVHLIQIYTYESIEEVLSNYANIDLIVCIGNHDLQQLVLNKSKSRVITSGYENFDLYIEDIKNIEFINKIVNTGLNINIYIKEDLSLDYPSSIKVMDLDEAIASINYNGSRYSASIFTSSSENASRFIKEVHAKMVTVNTSPTVERIMDLKVTDLTTEKTIIYPSNYKLTGESIKIDMNNESSAE